jgi:hypothetical protein
VQFHYFPISNDTIQSIQMNFINCSRKYNWTILSQKSLLDVFSRVKPNSLFVQISGPLINFFDKFTLDYVSVPAMIVCQKAISLRRSRWLWGYSYAARIAYSISDGSMEFRSLCLLCVVFPAAPATSWSLVRRGPAECVCVYV